MSKNSIGKLVVVLGLALLAASLLADTLGLGSGEEKFGWRQTTGAIAGAVVTIIGFGMSRGGKG